MTVDSVADLDAATARANEAYFTNLLMQYGLEDLAPWAAQQAAAGVGPTEFIVNLETQPAYQQQFGVITDRQNMVDEFGLPLPPLTPGQVLSFRTRVRELEQFYGLPLGTLNADKLLVQDVSYNEVQARVAFTSQLMYDEDPEVLDELQSMGIAPGTVLAYGLNPDVALPVMQEQVRIAQISVGARTGGIEVSGQEAALLEDAGVTRREAFERAGSLSSAGDLRSGVGGEFDVFERAQEFEYLSGNPRAVVELERRARRLTARFGGGGGFTRSDTGGSTGLGRA